RSLLDAARALAHLGRPEHAERLLTQAAARPALKAAAEELREAVRKRPAAPAAKPAPKPEPAPEPPAAPVADGRPPVPREKVLRPLLGLGPMPLQMPKGVLRKAKPAGVDGLWTD